MPCDVSPRLALLQSHFPPNLPIISERDPFFPASVLCALSSFTATRSPWRHVISKVAIWLAAICSNHTPIVPHFLASELGQTRTATDVAGDVLLLGKVVSIDNIDG